MDKIDQKLLATLDAEPRITTTKLAKACRISQQVADYRLKRLRTNGTIRKLGAIINLKALGLEHYRLFFRFSSKNKFTYKDIFNYLKDQSCIYWASRIGGQYDLQIVIFVWDFAALDEFVDRFNKRFPNLIQDYTSTYVIQHNIYRHKYLHKGSKTLTYNCSDPLQHVDDTDMAILRALCEDCRTPALQIAQDTNVTYKTVINRTRQLESKGILLGYRLFLNSPNRNPFVILVSYRDYNQDEERKLIAHLATRDEVTQTLRTFGRWQLYIHLRTENIQTLQEFIISIRDKFNIINEYETIPILEDLSINLLPLKELRHR